MARSGLWRNALYLVRPDGYVALTNAEGSAMALTSYLDAHRITSRPKEMTAPRAVTAA